jgi:hypothetical protein
MAHRVRSMFSFTSSLEDLEGMLHELATSSRSYRTMEPR